MLTSKLNYNPESSYYSFKKDDFTCPVCHKDIVDEIHSFMDVVSEFREGDEYNNEIDYPGPVCPHCEAELSLVVNRFIMELAIAKDD